MFIGILNLRFHLITYIKKYCYENWKKQRTHTKNIKYEIWNIRIEKKKIKNPQKLKCAVVVELWNFVQLLGKNMKEIFRFFFFEKLMW